MHTIVARDLPSLQAFAKRWGWHHATNDWKSAVASDEIGLVDVTTPNNKHMDFVLAALEAGFAANVAGGSHHAMPDGGAGYCVLNDLAVTAAGLLDRGLVQRLLVIDLDVHQGDGTAVCLAGRTGAFTFSIHAERTFPARKARSSRDVGLPDGAGDAAYLETLAAELPDLFTTVRPQLVLVQAGVDPHADDRLGRLALSDDGLAARDGMVHAACRAAGVPLVVTLGGGYDADLGRLGLRHARSLLALAGLPLPDMPERHADR
jgi:acetoin utilization deacetylase AcuC-like enzyme